MNIDIKELINANIINSHTGEEILRFYSKKSNYNKLQVSFAIIGALLVGLGIISIIAHNWDSISLSSKLIISFIPLIIAQLIGAFSLIKRKDNKAFSESSSLFISLAVAASISLVSQTYNIMGSLDSFIFIWMILSLPLIYLFNSKSVAILYLIGITSYAWIHSFNINDSSYTYWVLLVLLLPFYYAMYIHNKQANSFRVISWLLALSLLTCLGSLAFNGAGLISVAYISLFVLFIIGGDLFLASHKNNAYTILGSVSLIFTLIAFSFDGFGLEIKQGNIANDMFSTNEYIAAIFVSILTSILLYYKYRENKILDIKIIDISYIVFILIFIVGISNTLVATILCNILVLLISISKIYEGSKTNSLSTLNFGLISLMILIACRFIDIDISFVYRGILFILLGSGFFAINYYMLQKTKKND